MSRYDNNSGPLTLIHDLRHLPKEEVDKLNATPRSLDQNLNNPTSTVGNFRIKGFVNNNFVKPTIPRTIPNQGILTSADDPKLDLKIPSPKNSVGSPQKSVTSLPKSVASPVKSAGLPSPTKSVGPQSPVKSVGPPSLVRAAGLPSHPVSKGSAQGSNPAMDGRQSHQSSQRRDLTSRSSQNRHQHLDQNFDPSTGWAKERPSPRYNSQDHPLSYRSVNQHQGRHYSEDYESNQNIPIRNAHEKTQEQIRKETQQYIDRKEEERKFKADSQNRLREKQEDQRRTREMLEDHEPFGRPGAGAPNGSDNKKKKFIEEQFNARGEPARYQYEPTSNGAQNPDMAREQDQGLDGMPPFHSPGRNGMVTDRQRYDQVKENLGQLRRENEALERSSPDPLTHPDAYLKQKAMFQEFDPWGRGVGNPHRDSGGNVARYPFKLGRTQEGFGPTYGNFYKTGISSPKSAPDTNIRYDENPYDNLGKSGPARKPNREYLPAYDPFSKPGAGAPRQGVRGERVTQIQGLMDRSSMENFVKGNSFLNIKPDRQEEERMNEKIMQKKYREDLDVQVAQNTRKGNEQDRHKHESQRDYADIIDSYRARPRSKHHLPHSDISRARDGRVPVDFREAREYHEELDVGFSNNLAKKRLDRMKDYQESRRHIDKMSTYWGRYGGGNRKSEQHTHKGNLDNLINNEEKGRFSMTDVYVKGKDWSQFDDKTPGWDDFTTRNAAPQITPRYDSNDDLSPRYTRVTVDSHHANQYDYPMTGPSFSKKYYEMKSPWAPH
ncbi:uncharacterized protein LOC110449121 isoform X2 [Mizuhopecten yessoensis]|uniref:uncharacterized protein LOC110449121 isoform X2 n=1 Tax=Mizuhopecten yessoensis TaxID=6573 RepID=UPI000B459817|nr:uncharacterized protein LOC110449121 isoform X2 [Mizuhopecten yessoensis]